MQTVPTPPPINFSGLFVQKSQQTNPFSDLSRAAAREALRSKREDWAELDLRQDFADEAWMKQHIKASGLRVPYWKEPATATRLRSLLHKAGINGTTTNEALGTTLGGYLELNPLLPLWAALALVIEATGLFTPAETA
jgi:hypothetical protein